MKWFRLAAVLIVLLLNGQVLYGQFGVRAYYGNDHMGTFDQLGLVGNYQEIDPTSHISVQLDYWLRLKNYRIEFYPYVSYERHQLTYTGSVNAINFSTAGTGFGVGLVSHIYPFDLQGDCDCPTFSKQSGFVKKGFFVMGGIGGQNLSFSTQNNPSAPSDSRTGLNLQAGIGLDIGVSNLITVSPILRYSILPGFEWNDPGLAELLPSKTTSQFQFGIRVGFRPDYK